MGSWFKELLRDARKGLRVTWWYLQAAARKPHGEESSDWRRWIYPAYVGLLAPLALIGAAINQSWIPAVPISVAIGAVALVMLARLARRWEREHPAT